MWSCQHSCALNICRLFWISETKRKVHFHHYLLTPCHSKSFIFFSFFSLFSFTFITSTEKKVTKCIISKFLLLFQKSYSFKTRWVNDDRFVYSTVNNVLIFFCSSYTVAPVVLLKMQCIASVCLMYCLGASDTCFFSGLLITLYSMLVNIHPYIRQVVKLVSDSAV